MFRPVSSRITKRVYRQTSQDVCPWNVRFAQALQDDSPYQPRELLAGKDARTLARELIETSREKFSASLKGSPMKRAKLRALKRNATVVLGNVGSKGDVPVLAAALSDGEPLIRSGCRRHSCGRATGAPTRNVTGIGPRPVSPASHV